MKPNGVEYKLDKTRTVRFNLKSLIKLEKEFKKNIFQMFATDETGVPFFLRDTETVLTFLYIGFLHEEDDLTEDKLIDLIDEYSSAVEARTKLNEAFTESLSMEDAKEETKKKKQVTQK
jgi:hypothetical protein